MRKTLLLGLVAGVVLGAAPAASATTLDYNDATGDVMTAIMNQDGTTTYHREGGAEGDITFARLQHSASQVLVYFRFRQLSVPKQYGAFDYILEGNNGVQREVIVNTRHGLPQGTVEVVNTATGNDVRCATSHQVNYGADSMSLRINRSCLGTPKYVRMRNVSYQLRGNATSATFYYDDPNRDGGTINQVQTMKTKWVVTN